MAIPSTFKVEIEDASLVWVDVTALVSTLRDGTTSKDQIVSRISIDFNIDADGVNQYLDSTLNPDRPRIRVTENTTTTYYTMEDESGRVQQDFVYPITGGRVFAGRISDFPLLTYVNPVDINMSSLASQICVEDVSTQSGASVPVVWLATQDPVVPGKRIEFNRADRLGSLRDLAGSCGAGVRESENGKGFEVFDIPSKELTGSASFGYSCPLTLSYNIDRIDKPLNAIRIKGAAFDYSIGKIPVITAYCSPDTIVADGINSTTGYAQVIDANGVQVKHTNIVDDAIDADSFTEIPVSGCYAVTAIWTNDGTQSIPIKGGRIDYITFNASTITVAAQISDLFIVSYVQAQSVSWAIEDYADRVSESQNTTGSLSVTTNENIGQVEGVYLASDVRRIGTNFFTGGSFVDDDITLGISPGTSGTAVLVDYIKVNLSPLAGVNVSPTSSLCDSEGIATTVIGSGTTAGIGYLVASALGQQGFARLSLTGVGVGALTLSANPSRIKKNIEDETIVNPAVSEESVVTIAGADAYILVDTPVYLATFVLVTGYPGVKLLNWENVGGENRVYIFDNTGDGLPPDGTQAFVNYRGFAVVSEESKTSVITASVFDADNEPATDGTAVEFEFATSRDLGCTLSSSSGTTVDGAVVINLTSGSQTGTVTVRALSGGFSAEVDIQITDDDNPGGIGLVFGESGGWSWETKVAKSDAGSDETCTPVPNDDNDDDGSISGARRIVGCDDQPLGGVVVVMKGVASQTSIEGYFTFANGSTGKNTITVNGKDYAFNISPKDSDSRGGSRLVCK